MQGINQDVLWWDCRQHLQVYVCDLTLVTRLVLLSVLLYFRILTLNWTHTPDLLKVLKTAGSGTVGEGNGHSGAAASSPLLLLPPANTYLPFCDLISSSHKCQAVQVRAS